MRFFARGQVEGEAMQPVQKPVKVESVEVKISTSLQGVLVRYGREGKGTYVFW